MTSAGGARPGGIVGEYVLTLDDVLNVRKFDDGIAKARFFVDIHSPDDTGPVRAALPASGRATTTSPTAASCRWESRT